MNWKGTLIGFAGGIVGALCIYYAMPPRERILVENTNSQTQRYAQYSDNLESDFIQASAASTASVVFIKTVSTAYNQMSWFDYFFNGGGGSQQQMSSGSGVIFTKNGYIVTNNHVIDKAEKIEVVHGKRSYEAKLIGTDPSTDLAVLKVESTTLPAIKIGSARNLQVGAWVLAVGNPFNLNSTVTAGIVSAKGRHVGVVTSRFPIESFIQTDAAINPGNSGGALVNVRGELVGINTAILSHTGSYAGYGFAVPVDIVHKIVNDIIEFGYVQKAFSGLEVTDRATLSEKDEDLSGVSITYVQANSTAADKGLKKGDIILQIDNSKINTQAEYDEQMSYYRPGDKIKIVYKRNGNQNVTELTLTNSEGSTALLKKEIYTATNLGADLEMVSKVERDRLGIKSGIRIAKIKNNGLVRRLGIEEGFIITTLNSYAPKSPQELADILEKIQGRVVIEGITEKGVKGYYQFMF